MFMTDVSSRTGVPREGKGGVAAGRPLRRDAEANRRRILAAAGRVFAERGLEVTMDDIAAAAGVGVGTVYRRSPTSRS
jgi:AcrR family transcriptional regulator